MELLIEIFYGTVQVVGFRFLSRELPDEIAGKPAFDGSVLGISLIKLLIDIILVTPGDNKGPGDCIGCFQHFDP